MERRSGRLGARPTACRSAVFRRSKPLCRLGSLDRSRCRRWKSPRSTTPAAISRDGRLSQSTSLRAAMASVPITSRWRAKRPSILSLPAICSRKMRRPQYTKSKRRFPRITGRAPCLTRPGLRLAPVKMRGVDAQNTHLAGEELEFLQRPCERQLLWVPVDIGEELGRGELPAFHVALELGHVDAVGGEAAKRLVECGGNVAHAKDEGRDHRPF